MVNNFTATEAPLFKTTSDASLRDVNIRCATTWGALGGFYYNGTNITHKWSLVGINQCSIATVGLPIGSYDISNIANSDTATILLNSAPIGGEHQLGAMLERVTASNFRINVIKVDSNQGGTTNQRNSGFSGTIFGYIPNSLITSCDNTAAPNNFAGKVNLYGNNTISSVYAHRLRADLYGTSYYQSGLLAYGEIRQSGGGFFVVYRNPNLQLSYTRYGNGHFRINTNFSHTNFSCSASHTYGNGEDSICQVFQSGNSIEIRCRGSIGNDVWKDKTVYFAIFGVM